MVTAQAVGIAVADRIGFRTELARELGVLAIVVALLFGRRRWIQFGAAIVLAGSGGALALGHQLDEAAAARSSAPRELTLEGTVRDLRRASHWSRVELESVVAIEPGLTEIPGVVQIGADPESGAFAEVLPGDRLRARVRLRPPAPVRNPGRPDTERRLARAGIGSVGRLAHPRFVTRLPEREGWRPLAALHALRFRRGESLGRSGEGGALLRALCLGDPTGLSDKTREQFARLGLAHLLAVSGLHLTLIAGFVYGVFRVLLARIVPLCARWDSRTCAAVAALLGALGYALLAGWGVPVRRAWGVVVGMLIALLAGRPRAWMQPLAAVALWVLVIEPHALFLPGAQLSFIAATALTWCARRDRLAGGRIARGRLGRLVSTSAVAIAATAPLAAVHWGQAAPFSLLANLVAVPWTALILLPAALCALLCAGAAEGSLAGAGLGTSLWIARVTLRAVDEVATGLPGPGLEGAPGIGWIALAALVGGCALWFRGTWMRAAVAGACCALLGVAPPASFAPRPPRLVALDVGQGDAWLVQGVEGAVLVDAGFARPGGVDRGRRSVLPALGALGVTRIDLMIVSHADLDHRGGVPAVLAAVPVGELWLPPGAREDRDFDGVVEAAAHAGVPAYERSRASPPLSLGDLRVVPLWPPPVPTGLSRNDASLVVRIEAGARRVLLPGDISERAERAMLASGADLRADVLALPHHGSRTSSSAAFLAAVGARIAIASAPCWGRFEMPHERVQQRVRETEAALGWTGRDGAVFVALNAEQLRLEPFAAPRSGCGGQ